MRGGSPAGVALHGSGIAAAAFVHVLAGENFPVFGDGGQGAYGGSAPVVMLGEQAVGLLSDLFRKPLFSAAHRIDRRIVRWGGGDPAVVPHRALAISGVDLAAALPQPTLQAGEAAFTVHTVPPFPQEAMLRFGSRPAAAAPVQLAPTADTHAALVEATEAGWLFLIPQGQGAGWLLSVGGDPDALLASAPLVASSVASLSPVVARFETAPRMLQVLVGEDFLALGHHALAFDPICGDGTATAARAAILAAAVVAGIAEGQDADLLLGHYNAMMVAAMRRHLQVSLPFYRSGGGTTWWLAQADAVAEGHAWCTRFLARVGDPRFVLQGNRLIPREKAA
ncbi:hypothetical protein [Novosphingobium cyanobacteriorum]|uniref:Uncharacterized protein n=1 Tax=Novosphingobium cyanobacteriorum TaxID=3024215 RepID=A0ABT6CLF1_9SPHN|nr:hypothetical protein [Novosphingobium cyanobacteriorum]MDF8334750.1 hypothetical protein [Novosphingobium cyanobacteriorum]